MTMAGKTITVVDNVMIAACKMPPLSTDYIISCNGLKAEKELRKGAAGWPEAKVL